MAKAPKITSATPTKTAAKPASKPARKKLTPPPPPVKKSRSTVPIQSTLESIRGYPAKLKIYKIPASDNYWVRYFDGKRIKRSTGTSNKAEAKEFAKEFFDEIQYNKRHGINIFKNTDKSSFFTCAEAVIEENELALRAGELSPTYVKGQKLLIRNYVMEFFGDMEIQKITYIMLTEFKVFLLEKDCKSATIKTHFAAVKKIFNYAEKIQLIKARPHFPILKGKDDDARPPFNELEYITLRKKAWKLVDTAFELRQYIDEESSKKLRNVYITKELSYLIGFMVYTFIRPSDVKTIQHKHIERRSKKRNYLWMPIPETKKHGRAIVSMPNAIYFYNRLLDLRKKQGLTVTDDDYVFGHGIKNRDTAYRQIVRQFDKVLEETNLKEGPNGVNRALYSLRHTALMFLAKKNTTVDRGAMASNARTSTNMLDRFYLSKLENNDLADALHSKDTHKKIKPKKPSKVFATPTVGMSLKDFADAIDPKKGNKQVIIAPDGSLQIKKD